MIIYNPMICRSYGEMATIQKIWNTTFYDSIFLKWVEVVSVVPDKFYEQYLWFEYILVQSFLLFSFFFYLLYNVDL